MANYWVFKTENHWLIKSLDTNANKLETNDNKIVYQFEQRRNFNGIKGDLVIFLIKKAEKWVFAYSGTIDSVDFTVLPDIESSDIIKRLFLISVSDISPIKESYSINDFGYTLLKIYKWFDKPMKHFIHTYIRLDKSDFEAIINGQIFISRTAFGKTLNALNIEHRKSFLQLLIQENSDLYVKGNDYVKAFSLLKEYIETYIYTDVERMKDIGKYLLKLNEGEASKLNFVDPEEIESRGANIMKQVAICNEFLHENHELGYLEILFSEIKNVSADEKQLSELFINRPLPIFLN